MPLPNCPSVRRGRSFSQNQTEFYSDFGGNANRYAYHSYLDEKSTVIEIGGYTGVDIMALRELWGTFKVFMFEPLFFALARAPRQTACLAGRDEPAPREVSSTTCRAGRG